LKRCINHSQISIRLFGLILSGLLVIGVAWMPRGAVAQHAHEVTAQQYVAPPNPKAAHPPAHSTAAEEEEEKNQYRHAPIVQSLAKMLHLDVESAARLFEFINFGIIALAIVIPLAKFLPKLFRRRSQKVRQDLESARKQTEDANARLSAVEAKLASIDQEIAKFRAEVEQEMARDEERIKASLEEERARIVASAEQEITQAAAQAKRGLRHFAADLAIEKAAKQLVLTPETDRALIEEFVREASNGGLR
jgi:F-type H+-transporting ATPase subunit b